jgi:Protein of unknown function (DUF3467)
MLLQVNKAMRTRTFGLIFIDKLRRRAMKRTVEDICGKPRLEGRFANNVQIGVNESEVVLDFGQYFSGEDPTFHTRIIMTPLDAKALLETLTEALGALH